MFWVTHPHLFVLGYAPVLFVLGLHTCILCSGFKHLYCLLGLRTCFFLLGLRTCIFHLGLCTHFYLDLCLFLFCLGLHTHIFLWVYALLIFSLGLFITIILPAQLAFGFYTPAIPLTGNVHPTILPVVIPVVCIWSTHPYLLSCIRKKNSWP